MIFSRVLFVASLLVPLSSFATEVQKTQDVTHLLQHKIVVGQKEWVTVLNTDQRTIAKIDTGATTSSINAVDIYGFERNGKDMVSFKIKAKDDVSKEITLPVKRWVRIRQSSSTSMSRRPIVELDIKLGDQSYKTPFNLVNRDHMSNAILIGRSFLNPVALVDVEQQYIHKK